jgi:hypothetical protein
MRPSGGIRVCGGPGGPLHLEYLLPARRTFQLKYRRLSM